MAGVRVAGDHMAARPQYITIIVTQSIRHRCLTCSLLSVTTIPPLNLLKDTFADKYEIYLSYQQTYFTSSTNIKWKLHRETDERLAIIKNDTITKKRVVTTSAELQGSGQVTINIADTATLRFPGRCQGG